MRILIPNSSTLKCLGWGIGVTFLALLSSCNRVDVVPGSNSLNSRYFDGEPALSGDGRLLAFVSNRNGNSQIFLYDLQQKQYAQLASFNINNAIAQTPTLSQTGRYIVYISSVEGRPDIILYDRATKRSEIITQGYRSWVRNPHISPNGRYITFETARRGQWDIEVFDRGPNIELDISDGTPVVNP